MNTQSSSVTYPARLQRQLLAALACLGASASIAACASTAPYNPDRLADTQLSTVAQICQSVLGLSPAEGSNGATLLPANPHLEAGTTHYQGCVASLSDSLQEALASENAARADASCRSRGLTTGSPALALCVLREERNPTATETASLQSVSAQRSSDAPPAAGPFFYASGRDVRGREQLACASLGLDPTSQTFTSCVRGLQSTFFAIDNPIE